MTQPTDHGFEGAAFRRPGRGEGRMLLGVCGGLARRWDLEPGTVRAAFLVTLVPFGAGLLVYVALAVVMPADGASAQDAGRRGEIGRSLGQAFVVLTGVFAAALIGAVGAALAVFGLGPIALLLATALLAAIVFLEHDRLWLLGIATLALALPAAVVQLTNVTVARQAGPAIASPDSPAEVQAGGYRAGLGPLLVDLRNFVAKPGSTTTIRARADLRQLVVAMPAKQCFNIVVDYRYHQSWVAKLVNHYQGRSWFDSASGYFQRVTTPASEVNFIPPLVAYGQAISGDRGRFTRTAAPGAPTLHLVLDSTRSQMVVRDYPFSVAPLEDPSWPASLPTTGIANTARDFVVAMHGTGPAQEGYMPGPGAARLSTVQVMPNGGLSITNGRPRAQVLRNAVAAIGTAGTRDLAALTAPTLVVKTTQVRGLVKALSALGTRLDEVNRQAKRLAGACATPADTNRIRTRLLSKVYAEIRSVLRSSDGPELVRVARSMTLPLSPDKTQRPYSFPIALRGHVDLTGPVR